MAQFEAWADCETHGELPRGFYDGDDDPGRSGIVHSTMEAHKAANPACRLSVKRESVDAARKRRAVEQQADHARTLAGVAHARKTMHRSAVQWKRTRGGRDDRRN